MAANFWTSTHCKHWLFTKKSLDEAKEQCRRNLSETTLDVLMESFVQLIQKLGKRMQWRQVVIATAIVFFKRFYVRSSIVEFDPRLVVPTVLYLAAKVEEMGQIRVEVVTEHLRKLVLMEEKEYEKWGFPRWTPQQVYAYEFHLLGRLNFDMVVFHPYKSLVAFANDAKLEKECLQTAWDVVNDSLRTNISLMYPPYIIAIAALYVACTFHKKEIRKWCNKLNANLDEVREVMREIMALYRRQCLRDDVAHALDVDKAFEVLNATFNAQYQTSPSPTPQALTPKPKPKQKVAR